MNKIIVAALLVGISGTALIAAPTALNLEALPAELQAKIKAAQGKAPAIQDPLAKDINDIKASVAKAQAGIKQRFVDHPYLNENDSAKTDEAVLESSFNDINHMLSIIEKDCEDVQHNISVVNIISEDLDQQTFPYACGTFTGGTFEEGYIRKQPGKKDLAFYLPGDLTHQKEPRVFFKVEKYIETGTIGKSAWDPFNISQVHQDVLYKARVLKINGVKTAVCLGKK